MGSVITPDPSNEMVFIKMGNGDIYGVKKKLVITISAMLLAAASIWGIVTSGSNEEKEVSINRHKKPTVLLILGQWF